MVTSSPNPLKNTVDLYFYVHDTGLHTGALAFNNRIHGPSNTVSTSPVVMVVSKTIFF